MKTVKLKIFFSLHTEANVVPAGCAMIRNIGEPSDGICCRDVTSPINELDGQSNSSRGERSVPKDAAQQQQQQQGPGLCTVTFTLRHLVHRRQPVLRSRHAHHEEQQQQ